LASSTHLEAPCSIIFAKHFLPPPSHNKPFHPTPLNNKLSCAATQFKALFAGLNKMYRCQGRIKLFGAPRQWKHFRPLFQAVFLSGEGGYSPPPDWVKHHASQSQDRNNKYFILCIEFVAAYLLFRLAKMRHAWKGDWYLIVLVFSWQILFLLS
jgi:hypothetical protein